MDDQFCLVNRRLFPIYSTKIDKTKGVNMRISLADSRTIGFKKWSDALRPSDRSRADDDPKLRQPADDPTHAGVGTGKGGK
jgi:hypothetical protein